METVENAFSSRFSLSFDAKGKFGRRKEKHNRHLKYIHLSDDKVDRAHEEKKTQQLKQKQRKKKIRIMSY